jgi:hypothetical protein
MAILCPARTLRLDSVRTMAFMVALLFLKVQSETSACPGVLSSTLRKVRSRSIPGKVAQTRLPV